MVICIFSLQCDHDRHLFGAESKCQSFTVEVLLVNHHHHHNHHHHKNIVIIIIMQYSIGECSMGYYSPVLPENHG